MAVAVVVPWRPDDGPRSDVWRTLKSRHASHGRSVVEGTCDGPWCKAAAVADALTRTSAEVIAVHDADVWCDGLDDALAALDEAAWAIPHGKVHRLAEGHEPGGTLAQPPYQGYAGGGIVCVRRDVYERCPLDPRYLGWGQEDQSWALALTTLFGAPWRGDTDLWHWWHPPQERMSRSVGSRESKALFQRYKAADGNRRRMLALIAEVDEWPSTLNLTAAGSGSC